MVKCLIWDLTGFDTAYAPSYIQQTSERAGATAELATQRKHLKYSNTES